MSQLVCPGVQKRGLAIKKMGESRMKLMSCAATSEAATNIDNENKLA